MKEYKVLSGSFQKEDMLNEEIQHSVKEGWRVLTAPGDTTQNSRCVVMGCDKNRNY